MIFICTPIGHSLAGISIGLAAGIISPIQLATLTIMANLPDLPIKGWGHDKYNVSHSIPILTVMGLGTLILSTISIIPIYFLLLILALYSHVLLDACYEHGQGIACWWPFSTSRLRLRKLFKVMDDTKPFGEQSRKAYWREIQVFTIVLMFILFIRRFVI